MRPLQYRKKFIEDPSNLMPKGWNCSKGCKVEGIDGGWVSYKRLDADIDPRFKNFLQEKQDDIRRRIEQAIRDRRGHR